MNSPTDISGSYDVAVIGAGVVGCAVARRFAQEGYRTLLMERAPDILSGASKGNSALLHTGFDAPADSLELQCMQDGYREFLEVRERYKLPLLQSGALVIAWRDDEYAQLPAMAAKACANGVTDVEIIDAAAVREREPGLAAACGALWVPGEHIIDPWSTPLAYVTHAKALGATIACNTALVGAHQIDNGWLLRTNRGECRANLVINCAGLHGDTVEKLLLGRTEFTIKPRKGQFVVYDKPAARLLRHIVLPVPTERTKGVVVTRTIFGNVLVGPTAEEQDDREHAGVDTAQLQSLKDQAVRMLPGLREVSVNAVYAGLRPATELKEYRVRHDAANQYLAIGGIRSTGLTAALGLASHALALLKGTRQHASAAPPNDAIAWPTMPNLAEHLPRDWMSEGHGDIICHCEMVTRREIENALATPVPAGDIGGLKRRTRACMGRCQGFYCSAEVAAITLGRLASPLASKKS